MTPAEREELARWCEVRAVYYGSIGGAAYQDFAQRYERIAAALREPVGDAQPPSRDPLLAKIKRTDLTDVHPIRMEKHGDLSLVTREPVGERPMCSSCGRPATCVGRYEGHGSRSPACDECCGHGNEDGRCEPVGDAHPVNPNVVSVAADMLRDVAADLDRAVRAASSSQPASAEPVFDCGWCKTCGRLHAVAGGHCPNKPEAQPASAEIDALRAENAKLRGEGRSSIVGRGYHFAVVATLNARIERAERVLLRNGWTYTEGADEWKPPLGPAFAEEGKS